MDKTITIIDKEYRKWISDLSPRYRKSQIMVAVKVNQEMLAIYWSLGRYIVEKHAEDKWGESVIKNVSIDLRNQLPGATSATQHLSKDKFSYVPVQDFASNDDIDWRLPVNAIDRQLYQKYGFDDNDVRFIEQTIKPME